MTVLRVLVSTVKFFGPMMLHYRASNDPVEQKPADGSQSEALTAPGVRNQAWCVRR